MRGAFPIDLMRAIPGQEALIRKQRALAGQVTLAAPFKSLSEVRTVCGLDVRCRRGRAFSAAAVVLSFPALEIVEEACVLEKAPASFPCVPGFSAFRELPPLLKVIKTLKTGVSVFICGAPGIAHPQRLGLASHLGVTLRQPTIGCAQTPFYGEYDEPPPGLRGAYQYLRDNDGDILGVALRTKPYARPLFVSPGHLMDIETAGDLVLACCTKYRLPEPLRLAHRAAKK
ncbi:MAG: endonuclease V, partial [Endomicrobiales bacterium]